MSVEPGEVCFKLQRHTLAGATRVDSVLLTRKNMTALTHYYSPVSVQHPFAGRLAEICSFLPVPFTLQDVVEATEIHAPESVADLPGAWECLISTEQVETVGLCGSIFRPASEA